MHSVRANQRGRVRRISASRDPAVIPGKSYVTIRLLIHIYRLQVSQVIPGEQTRHHALLSLGPPFRTRAASRLSLRPQHSFTAYSLPYPTPSINSPRFRTPHRSQMSACSQKSARVVALTHASPCQPPRHNRQLTDHVCKRPRGILHRFCHLDEGCRAPGMSFLHMLLF